MNNEKKVDCGLSSLTDAKPNVSRRFWSGSSLPKIKWQPHWKSLTVDIFPYTNFRIWCYWSKFREEKTSFTLIFFGKFFWVSTTHLGKRLGKRLFLNALFGKDYHVYSSGDGVSSNGG
jgi:hypothetical protein